jgi:BRCA1 C Terminus (BRCT) domain
LEREIERCGGIVATAVSAKLDFLVVGADPSSSKVEKAEKLGIEVEVIGSAHALSFLFFFIFILYLHLHVNVFFTFKFLISHV